LNIKQADKDYRRVESALKYLQTNFKSKPSLKEIAERASLSEYHFQRIFTRWAGLSPERFIKYLTKENAKKALADSKSLLDAAYKSKLSSQGRLYDLFVTTEAVTPGEFKPLGAGLEINYGIHPSPFGLCFIALTERGICSLGFIDEKETGDVLSDFKRKWQNAEITEDQGPTTGRVVESIFDRDVNTPGGPFKLILRGTNFQIKVWEALLKIPPGCVVSYQDLALLLDKPKSARAVANAVASNPVAYLIPCHRVIRKMGVINGYRWGPRERWPYWAGNRRWHMGG